MADWQPLVTDSERTKAIDVIREIVAAIPEPPAGPATMSLHLDRAVFRAYLAQDDTIEDPDDIVGSSLVTGVTAFLGAGSAPALFSGACGVGWSIQHLAGGETADRVCTAVDSAVVNCLADWNSEYDLISGLVGIGIYALERGEAGHVLAGRVLDQLERTAQPRGGGVAWFTRPDQLPEWQREVCPDGYWNLGVAHGIPGVVGLLARYVRHDVFASRARPLLEQATSYLLAAEPRGPGPRFPGWHPASTPRSGRRVSWCYGDLGVACTVLAAAQACGRADWREEAIELAKNCAGADDDQILDTGLCHGTAGAMHLFARLAYATGDAGFADEARRWLARTFAMRRHGEDYAGFPMRVPDAAGDRFEADATLLNGAPGVALALHAMISNVEPTWDRVLLVDLGPDV
jgi:hypothetical protein